MKLIMAMLIIHCINVLFTFVITNAQVSDNFLLAADILNCKVHQISLTTKNLVSLNIPGLLSATGVTYDHRTREVYIADYKNRTVQRCTLVGTQCATFSTGVGYPDRIAMDFSTGNIFYTADASPLLQTRRNGYIGVINPSQNAQRYLLAGLMKPRDIALYSSKGWMFWTDHGLRHIGRSAMNGVGFSFIVSTNIKWPNGLAIDYSADRIYWTDGYYNRIESSDLHGKNRIIHLTDSGAHMVDIIVKGSYLYYSAWKKSIITKVSKNTYNIVPWMTNATELGRIDSIYIYPPDSQPTHQICSSNNGGCTTFCLPTSTSRTCKCATKIGVLSKNTCQKYTKCSTDLPNGKFSAQCSGEFGSKCSYECDSGYTKTTHGTKLIICQQNGQWNESPSSLCQATRCDTVFNGGRMSAQCSAQPGVTCSYECDKGFSKKTTRVSVICQLNGEWNEDISLLCQENKCHINLPHGRMVSECSGKIAEICFFQCFEGYNKHKKQGAVVCQSDGNWNTSLVSICKENKKDSEKPAHISTVAVGVGGGAGGLIIVVCIVIILLIFRNGKQRMSERSTQRIPMTVSPPPPVYYTPQNRIAVEYLTPIDQNVYDEIDVHVCTSSPVVSTDSQYETLYRTAGEARLYRNVDEASLYRNIEQKS